MRDTSPVSQMSPNQLSEAMTDMDFDHLNANFERLENTLEGLSVKH